MKILLRDYPEVLMSVDLSHEDINCRGGFFRHQFGGLAFLRGCCSTMTSSDRKALQNATWSLLSSYLYRSSWEGFEPFRGDFDALTDGGSCFYFDLVHTDDEVRGWVSSGIKYYLEEHQGPTDRSYQYCGVPYMYDTKGNLVSPEAFIDVCDRACEHNKVDLLLIDGFPERDVSTDSAFIDLARRHNLHIVFINTK